MISASEARDLINVDHIVKYKLSYIETKIHDAIQSGYSQVEVYIENTEAMHIVSKTLRDLGYSLGTEDDRITIGF